MKTKLLRSAIVLVVISIFITTYLRLSKKNAKHSAENQRNSSAGSNDVIQDAIAAGRRRTPKDISVDQIQELERTPVGRLNLCGIIGESALVGLSDNSYQQVLIAISDLEPLDETCLREIMLRLGNEVNEPTPPTGYSSYHSPSEQVQLLYPSHRSLEVEILLKNQDLTAKFMREEYNLGTNKASRFAIPLLITLHDRKSCADMFETVQALHKSANNDWRAFEKARKSICD